MCLRIRKGITVSDGAGGYEMQNAQTVVRMGEGGRVVNPVIWPKDRRERYTSSGTGTVTPYMIKCSQSFHDRNSIAIRALFNGIALEYLYKHLISPWFEDQFNVSGHSGLRKTVRDNYKTIISDKVASIIDDGKNFDTEIDPYNSDAFNMYMHYNRLFKNEKFTCYDANYQPSESKRPVPCDEITETKGSIGWLRKIRVLEEAVRDSGPTYEYEDDGLIFPTRYCFNITFPIKGNEGIILRLRIGGMVKQRGYSNPHKF
jgi:hypothetical protein